jgi:hypothetical protein
MAAGVVAAFVSPAPLQAASAPSANTNIVVVPWRITSWFLAQIMVECSL